MEGKVKNTMQFQGLLFVLSVVVLFCYFISISDCSYRRRKNIFVGQSSCVQESKKETVLRLLVFFLLMFLFTGMQI